MLLATLVFGSLGFSGRDRVAALAAAGRFLEAWRTRDVAAGLSLVSPRLRRTTKPDELRMAISGLSNPHHWAYEISEGRTLTPGRIAFIVRLAEVVTGEGEKGRRPDATWLTVAKGPGGWQVDGFPGGPVTFRGVEIEVLPDYYDALAEVDRYLAGKKIPYEVSDGRRLGSGRYAFAVHLYGKRNRATRLVVARSKNGPWFVSGQ